MQEIPRLMDDYEFRKELERIREHLNAISMKTLNNLRMKIMVRAFRIRIENGEAFEDIAADYPALTVDDLEAIKAELEK